MKLVERLLDLLYPPRCVFCRKIMDSSLEPVCKKCDERLPRTQGAGQCQKLPFIQKCVSPLYYEDLVRDSFLRYKFNGATGYSGIYAEYIAKSVDENGITCDIITWVPLSRRRLRSRGYDQARLLAEAVAKHLNVECCALLTKTVNNPAQSGTGSAAKRRANVSGVYIAKNAEKFSGKSVLLIDDIVTTGSTLSECAGVLRAAGAAKLAAATLARKRE